MNGRIFQSSLFVVAATIASGQGITTIAGNGTAGYTGDGGQSTQAEINRVVALASDAGGNIYLADQNNNVIRKININGLITTFAGTGSAGFAGDGGPATSAQLNSPSGVCIAPSGAVYVNDQGNARVREISTSGTITTVAGNGSTTSSGDGGPATSAGMVIPIRCAVDSNGNLYIADQGAARIRKVDGSGTITTFAGTGTQSYSGDGGAATAATLNNPTFVLTDSLGNLYVSDQYNQRVRIINSAGTITTVAGNGTAAYAGDGGPATSASLNYPGGLALDASGALYIVDPANNRLRKVSGGIITTVAGNGAVGFAGDGGSPLSAEFSNPFALTIDPSANLYIGDIGNDRVRKIGDIASQSYYFSDLAFSGGYQTTLTYINYSPQVVTCVTNFYSDAGTALGIPFSEGTVSTRTDTLQPGQSIHDQTVSSATPPYVEGWAKATCTGPVEASLLYRLYQGGVAVGEASVNAETAPTTEFATFAQTATGIAYGNPSTTQSAAVTVAVYNTAGTQLGSTVINLGPLAHGAANVGPLLGLSSFTGFVKITANIPIISLSLNAEVFPVFSSLPPGDLAAGTALVGSGTSGSFGPQTYYFSDLAFAGGYQTTLTYINYSPQAVTCVTNFYSDAGTPLAIPFSGGTVSSRTDTLQPGQSLHDQTISGPAGPYVEGWAQSTCTGQVEASLLYRLYQNASPVGEASVNAETAPTSEFVTFSQTATGVAYGNPSPSQSASVTITAYNAAGQSLGGKILTLGPLAHGAANIGPLLGISNFTGFVKITSTIPIISLSINAEVFPVFSSLPPGDLSAGTTLIQ